MTYFLANIQFDSKEVYSKALSIYRKCFQELPMVRNHRGNFYKDLSLLDVNFETVWKKRKK